MFKTYQQILNELIADWQTSSGTTAQPGFLVYTLFAVQARALRVVWYMLEQIMNLFFVSTSSGSFLERRCNERGVTRKAGTAATGNVTLTRTTAAPVGSTLLAGTTLATTDGKVEFTVNADVVLPVGWTSETAAVTCTTVGAAGNLAAGTPLQVVGAQTIGVQNIAVAAGGLTGGVDTETDEALRARYLNTIQNPINGGTQGDYVVWAMSQQGVTAAIPLPLNRGPGTIDVVIASNGIPQDSLVTTVQNYINSVRPVGADAKVLKPTAHPVAVTGAVTAATGYTVASLDSAVTTAITNYINSVPIGGVVRYASIILAAMDVPGVVDFSLSTPTANTQLGTTEMATVGTLTIT